MRKSISHFRASFEKLTDNGKTKAGNLIFELEVQTNLKKKKTKTTKTSYLFSHQIQLQSLQ